MFFLLKKKLFTRYMSNKFLKVLIISRMGFHCESVLNNFFCFENTVYMTRRANCFLLKIPKYRNKHNELCSAVGDPNYSICYAIINLLRNFSTI